MAGDDISTTGTKVSLLAAVVVVAAAGSGYRLGDADAPTERDRLDDAYNDDAADELLSLVAKAAEGIVCADDLAATAFRESRSLEGRCCPSAQKSGVHAGSIGSSRRRTLRPLLDPGEARLMCACSDGRQPAAEDEQVLTGVALKLGGELDGVKLL